jgi:hypothetical protein
MARFVVRRTDRVLFGASDAWGVVDTQDRDREVNRYAERPDAEARAAELNLGPLDLDAQEAWQPDEDDDDWGERRD